jgi:acetyl-CoA carboxylase biotin carboxyl carrier protein
VPYPEFQPFGDKTILMNLSELKEIIQQVVESDITEFEYEKAGTRIRIRRGSHETVPLAMPYVHQQMAPAPPPVQIMTSSPAAGSLATPAAKSEPEPAAEELHVVRSPIVGTFYRAPSPGAKPFVKPGDSVEVGMVLCIIEAMKLMNEIESDMAGEVVKILVDNSQPVEYGQPLYLIRPR